MLKSGAISRSNKEFQKEAKKAIKREAALRKEEEKQRRRQEKLEQKASKKRQKSIEKLIVQSAPVETPSPPSAVESPRTGDRVDSDDDLGDIFAATRSLNPSAESTKAPIEALQEEPTNPESTAESEKPSAEAEESIRPLTQLETRPEIAVKVASPEAPSSQDQIFDRPPSEMSSAPTGNKLDTVIRESGGNINASELTSENHREARAALFDRFRKGELTRSQLQDALVSLREKSSQPLPVGPHLNVDDRADTEDDVSTAEATPRNLSASSSPGLEETILRKSLSRDSTELDVSNDRLTSDRRSASPMSSEGASSSPAPQQKREADRLARLENLMRSAAVKKPTSASKAAKDAAKEAEDTVNSLTLELPMASTEEIDNLTTETILSPRSDADMLGVEDDDGGIVSKYMSAKEMEIRSLRKKIELLEKRLVATQGNDILQSLIKGTQLSGMSRGDVVHQSSSGKPSSEAEGSIGLGLGEYQKLAPRKVVVKLGNDVEGDAASDAQSREKKILAQIFVEKERKLNDVRNECEDLRRQVEDLRTLNAQLEDMISSGSTELTSVRDEHDQILLAKNERLQHLQHIVDTNDEVQGKLRKQIQYWRAKYKSRNPLDTDAGPVDEDLRKRLAAFSVSNDEAILSEGMTRSPITGAFIPKTLNEVYLVQQIQRKENELESIARGSGADSESMYTAGSSPNGPVEYKTAGTRGTQSFSRDSLMELQAYKTENEALHNELEEKKGNEDMLNLELDYLRYQLEQTKQENELLSKELRYQTMKFRSAMKTGDIRGSNASILSPAFHGQRDVDVHIRDQEKSLQFTVACKYLSQAKVFKDVLARAVHGMRDNIATFSDMVRRDTASLDLDNPDTTMYKENLKKKMQSMDVAVQDLEEQLRRSHSFSRAMFPAPASSSASSSSKPASRRTSTSGGAAATTPSAGSAKKRPASSRKPSRISSKDSGDVSSPSSPIPQAQVARMARLLHMNT